VNTINRLWNSLFFNVKSIQDRFSKNISSITQYNTTDSFTKLWSQSLFIPSLNHSLRVIRRHRVTSTRLSKNGLFICVENIYNKHSFDIQLLFWIKKYFLHHYPTLAHRSPLLGLSSCSPSRSIFGYSHSAPANCAAQIVTPPVLSAFYS
jgi:hypothetical protein